MIDTHAHIDGEAFDEDRTEMIQRAFDNGVEAIIIPAIEPSRFDNVLSLCQQYPQIYCGMGIHPHNAHEANDDVLTLVKSLTQNPKVKAIGEIGLDYYYDFAPKDIQKEVFRKQLIIAKECDLPVIIHNRDSDDDLLEILEQEQDGNLRGVLHCFSSSLEALNKALQLGMHISFTGNITYKKSTLNEVVATTPLDKIMIETDSPYMTPVPHRGKRNEPAHVRFVAEKIAEIQGTTVENIFTMTTNTAKHLFRLSLALFIGIMVSLSAVSLQAQDERDQQEEVEEQEVINPYPKFIGFGPSVATNTIIETYTNQDSTNNRDTRSFDGNPGYGFSVTYNPVSFLMVDAGMIFTANNSKLKNDTTQTDPDTYTMLNLSVRAISNPHNKVSFFALAGVSYIAKKVSGLNGVPGFTNENLLGFNAGAGFMVNIPTDYGLIVPIAEWRLDFEGKSNTVTMPKDEKLKKWGLLDLSIFYSLPRLSLIWYPKF